MASIANILHEKRSSILGAVLAGGKSSRFGSDKASAMLDGKPLIVHVTAALGAHVDAIIICGPPLAGYISVPDYPASGLGPIGAIAAALRYGASHGYPAVLTVPCDTPFLPEDVARKLGTDGPAYIASAPVVGFWPTILLPEMCRHLGTTSDFSIEAWAGRVDARPVHDVGPIFNINTPEDLARLQELRQQRASLAQAQLLSLMWSG